MSYDYFDASPRRDGYLAPGPSYTGQIALRNYVLSQPQDLQSSEIRFYFNEGYSDFPRRLASDLSRLPIPSDKALAGRLRDLIRVAQKAAVILILSDGVS